MNADKTISPADLNFDPLNLVCSTCSSGLFSYAGFRKAISTDFESVESIVVDTNPRNRHEARREDDDLPFKYVYKSNWGTISGSAIKEACNWCALLIRCRSSLPNSLYLEENVTIRVDIKLMSHHEGHETKNYLSVYLNDFKTAIFSIYAESGNVAAQEIGYGNLFRNKPSFVDYIKTKKCIESCGTHKHCRSSDETVLPSRVIDCSDLKRPKLFETHRKVKGSYAALSYVWGGDQKQKTIKANLHTYINEGLPIRLAQTISDAITVTHNLGLKFLWVDAFCIIQDSEEDKLRELADMAHIYQDSYITLSVLSSYRADQGFLPDSGEDVSLPFYVKDTDAGPGKVGIMRLRYHLRNQNPLRGPKFQTVQFHEPLHERGWCFQESTLSPRLLMFNPPLVRYKCRSIMQDLTRVSERGTNNPPFDIPTPVMFSYREEDDPIKAQTQRKELRNYWGQLLYTYTACKITVPSDKFVAFSSVAEVFQSVLKDDCVAGLWRRTLIDDLLWQPFGKIGPDEVLLPRPIEYRAPTWSWGSIDIPVQMHRQHMLEAPSTDYEAEVIACDVKPKSTILPLGEVLEAKLTIKAKIHPLMLDARKCKFTERKGTTSVSLFTTTHLSGGWVAPDGNCLQSAGKTPDWRRDESEVTFDCEEGSEQDRNLDFYVVMLRAGRKWGTQDQSGWMKGLLLLKCEDATGEIYRRVARIDLIHLPVWFDTVQSETVSII